jgi:hypothetical protein
VERLTSTRDLNQLRPDLPIAHGFVGDTEAHRPGRVTCVKAQQENRVQMLRPPVRQSNCCPENNSFYATSTTLPGPIRPSCLSGQHL